MLFLPTFLSEKYFMFVQANMLVASVWIHVLFPRYLFSQCTRCNWWYSDSRKLDQRLLPPHSLPYTHASHSPLSARGSPMKGISHSLRRLCRGVPYRIRVFVRWYEPNVSSIACNHTQRFRHSLRYLRRNHRDAVAFPVRALDPLINANPFRRASRRSAKYTDARDRNNLDARHVRVCA